METRAGTWIRAGISAIALSLTAAVLQPGFVSGQTPAAIAPLGNDPRPPDTRVQQRSYRLTETNEEIPYSLYVSSKVSKSKKNPLIVALHGRFMNHNTMVRGTAIDLAEAGGYILVGPMGYNIRGWYGVPPGDPSRVSEKQKQATAGDPPNIRELSENDVMNVLALTRKEFNVDENRIYLMGHSMGGAGVLHLGTKYSNIWAALSAIAPAAFTMETDAVSILTPIKSSIPVFLVQGAADTDVPVANTRRWAEALKALGMEHRYLEISGANHASVLEPGVFESFKFFDTHVKHSR